MGIPNKIFSFINYFLDYVFFMNRMVDEVAFVLICIAAFVFLLGIVLLFINAERRKQGVIMCLGSFIAIVIITIIAKALW